MENQRQIDNKTGQWLGATVSSAGVDGPVVVSTAKLAPVLLADAACGFERGDRICFLCP